MKKAAIIRRLGKPITQFKQWLKKCSCVYSAKNPDFVVSIGGDGTFLFSERKYPGVPKLLVRESRICHKCDEGIFESMIERIYSGDFFIKEELKLEAVIKFKNKKKDKVVHAINDIVVRNKIPIRALRFKILVSNKRIDGELIGDGVVISTPFGASAYYHAVTKKKFSRGIGIAFNNLVSREKPMVVKDDSRIVIEILREKALVAADNNPLIYEVDKGDRIEIRKAEHTAKLIRLR